LCKKNTLDSVIAKSERREGRRKKAGLVLQHPWPAMSTQLRHPSLPARPSRGSGVTHVHLLRRIPSPFRVNFQNLGFSFELKTIFEELESSFEALESRFEALETEFDALESIF
jgi:hypothetical protein